MNLGLLPYRLCSVLDGPLIFTPTNLNVISMLKITPYYTYICVISYKILVDVLFTSHCTY